MPPLPAPGRFDPRATGERTKLSLALLRGTTAALRCRTFVDQGAWAEAAAELVLLQAVIRDVSEVADPALDAELEREIEGLRASEARLRSLVAELVAATLADDEATSPT